MSASRPFEKDHWYESSCVETLQEWLETNGKKDLVIGGEYTVEDLIRDLGEMAGQMWSDGIDARGEDA